MGRIRSVFFILIWCFSLPLKADLRVPIVVYDTEDRWITFADAQKLYHGQEVSPLLLETLFQSQRFILMAPPQEPQVRSLSLGRGLATEALPPLDLTERLPGVEFHYQLLDSHVAASQTLAQGPLAVKMAQQVLEPQIVIRPRIETLLYASGSRSNRIVYGFSPERLNPFNAGRRGSLDNEFTKNVDPENPQQCGTLDLFQKQFEAEGFGPWLSNFGADADEGFVFSLPMFGFGFKRKAFETKSQVVFDVEYPSLRITKTYRYELKGKGLNIFLAGQYAGYTASVEIQKRKTLRQVLVQLLPEITQQLEKDIPSNVWQSKLLKVQNQWVIPGGEYVGLQVNDEFISPYGSKYKILKLLSSYAVVEPSSDNRFQPFDGEVVKLFGANFDAEDSQSLAMSTDAVSENLGVVNLGDVLPKPPSNLPSSCKIKKMGRWERLLQGLLYIYGLIRYHTVFDQDFDSFPVRDNTQKVALVGTGVSPKESALKPYLDGAGFDFISWDKRPSDDNGAGTVAAKYLLQSLKHKNDLSIVPVKVVGAHGETHSSAIYEGFQYIAQREDIKTVLVLFSPAIDSQAYRQGIELLVKAGKHIIVPKGTGILGTIESETPTKEYKDRVLGGVTARLDAIGMAVLKKGIEILNQ